MSRYIEIARQSLEATTASAVLSFGPNGALLASVFQEKRPQPSIVPRVNSPELMTFIVKLRNATTRMWGDQIEVRALSAADAAEDLAGEDLVEGGGERADLRVSVWPTPFGSKPCKLFYVSKLH